MKTYTPISGMIVCQNNTGEYVLKSDYAAVSTEVNDLRDHIKKLENEIKRLNCRVFELKYGDREL